MDVIDRALSQGGGLIDFGNVQLSYDTPETPVGGWPCKADQYFMAKSVPYITGYMELADSRRFRSILEIGIFKGGSVVFLDQLFKPDRLSAVELNSERLPKLDDYVARHGIANINLHYGIDQADRKTLRDIVDRDFDAPLDLVIDDASHCYAQTKASFETLFPRLGFGGVYIIEDWNWGHTRPEDGGDGNEDITRLLFEIITLHAKHGDIVTHMSLQPGFFSVTKGARPIRDDFHL